jgi:hypothetical protein
MTMMMAWLLGIVALWIGAAALPFFIFARRWRWRWQEVTNGEAPVHAGASLYREAGTVPTYLREAPPLVRAAAFSCLLLGQLLIPYLVIACMALFFFGIGLVLLPIIITAGKLYRAGLLLLRREPRTAYFAARNAAFWSLWCVGLGGFGCFVTLCAAFDWGLLAAMVLAITVIVAQALLLLRATRRYEDALFASSRMVRLGDHWIPTDAAA